MDNKLYYELLKAHDIAAVENPNGSFATAMIVYKASGNMTQALAAASLAQGYLHAPIEQARELLRLGPDGAPRDAAARLEYKEKVPGFGNSFYKGEPDPAFAEVERIIREEYPVVAEIIDNISKENPKLPPPNAAMWTAAVLEIYRMPRGIGPAVFISARVKSWAYALLEDENTPAIPEVQEETDDSGSD